MKAITLSARYDAKHIVLEEPLRWLGGHQGVRKRTRHNSPGGEMHYP